MMLNFTGLVTLSRKPTVNASQNARKRLEYVRAETADAA